MEDANQSRPGTILSGNTDHSERFEDIQLVYTGDFNTIAKAKRYGRWWAIKSLKEEMRGDEAYETLLRKEFDILISMQHPNVVSAVGFEYVAPLGDSIVMEWVEGQSLKAWLGEKHTRRERLHIVSQILSALNYIHTKQVVVRDLKPSNVMITYNGRHVKLIDFGLSDADSYTIFKQPAGSPGYMSPEQGRSRVADIRNDIYSLGSVLDELNLGKPYAGIVNKCKAPLHNRYANVEDVRRAFNHIIWLRRITVPFPFIVLLMGGLLFSLNKISNGQEVICALETQLDSTHLELRNIMEEKRVVDCIIEEGKRRMDSIAQYDLDTLTTFEACTGTYTRLANQLLQIHETYCDSAYSRVSQNEYILIRQTLSDYFSVVLKPLEDKVAAFVESRRKAGGNKENGAVY